MMCQGTVFLNGEGIMRDVVMVEPMREGVRVMALFEPVRVVPAAIRQIDLIKHRVILVSLQEIEESRERSGETVGDESV